MRSRLLLALLLAGCASVERPLGPPGPVHVVVTAQSPLKQSDADRFRRITEDYVRVYVHDGPQLTVSITLGEQTQTLSMSNDYSRVDVSYSTQTGHQVPLVGGMTAAEVGFVPMVGGGGYSSPVYFGGGALTAHYTITDASGRVLESRVFPLVPLASVTPVVTTRLQDFQDGGRYIAKRVAKMQ
jgi:hypothetical protein